jgi:hypothetical protein
MNYPAVMRSETYSFDRGIKPKLRNKLTVEECSPGHLAYPSGLLPERSWKKLTKSFKNKTGFSQGYFLSWSHILSLILQTTYFTRIQGFYYVCRTKLF